MSVQQRTRAHATDAGNARLGAIRQWLFPVEFRIGPADPWAGPRLSAAVPAVTAADGPETAASPAPSPTPVVTESSAGDTHLATELANCLWYLKTKYFRRSWNDWGTEDDDPRVRRALGRLHKGVESLKTNGYEVHDPTNERYPQGGEAMMRPLDFIPTAGLSYDVVSETIAPVVYRGEQLVRRGEVFVAVPQPTAGVDAAEERKTTPSGPSNP